MMGCAIRGSVRDSISLQEFARRTEGNIEFQQQSIAGQIFRGWHFQNRKCAPTIFIVVRNNGDQSIQRAQHCQQIGGERRALSRMAFDDENIPADAAGIGT